MVSLIKTIKIRKVTSWLLFLVLVAFTFSFTLFALKSKTNVIAYVQSQVSGTLKVEKDSWAPMVVALDYLKKNPGKLVYREIFFNQGIKFQYPLSSLLVFDIPQKATGGSYGEIIGYLNSLSLISVFLIGITCAAILSAILKKERFKHLLTRSGLETFQIYFLSLLITLLFYPLLRSYVLGQIQTMLTLLVSLALLAWLYDKKNLTGVLFGVVCVIKPQMALIFIWALLRKQWGMVISGLVVVVLFSVVAITFYGFENNLGYLEVLSFLSRRGEVFYANQSVNGLVNRLMFNGSNLDWDGKFPRYLPIVYILTMVSSLVLMFGALFWNFKDKHPHIIDLSIMLLATTMASPIAWEHHFGILLPVFFIMLPFLLAYFTDRKWYPILFLIAFVLCSQYFGFVKVFANNYLNFVQSYLFFGAVIILYLLVRLSMRIHKRNLQYTSSSIVRPA